MRTDLLPEVEQPVQVLIKSRDGRKVEVNGTVRWTTAQFPGRDKSPGFGMQVEPLTDTYRDFYQHLLLN